MAADVAVAGPTVYGSVNAESEGSALLRLHDSLLQDILRRMDIQSRVAASVTCRRLAQVSGEHPPSVVDLSSDGVHPEACRRYIERAKGAIVILTTARQQQRTACDATSARRFSTGVRCTQVVPYTSGPSAARLAAALPNLQHLALHEATSCLGGMTDEFAVAVAANCPLLNSLEVAFTRYSLPSECFTDAGMMALASSCPRLRCLSLTNCGAITDRSLYAVAVHCRGLRSLALGGYHELISDYGTVVLFQACSGLVRVVLSGKLRRVTDESVEALATNSGPVLQEIKLTRSMGARSLAALAAHCGELRMVDCCKCEPGAVTAEEVASLLAAVSSKHDQAAAMKLGAAARSWVPAAAAPPPPPPAATETLLESDRCSVGECASPRGLIRVVLPRGLAAADVVRHAPGGDAGAARWRAVRSMAVKGGGSGACTGTATCAGGAAGQACVACGGGGAAAATAAVLKVGASGGGGGNVSAVRGGSAPEAPFDEVVVRLLQGSQ